MGLMAASAAALCWEPRVLIGFRHSWWPLPANLCFYGPWFALGWLAETRRGAGAGRPFATLCEWRLVASLGVFAVLLPRIHQHVAAPLIGLERVLLVSLFVLHAWLVVTGLFGTSLRRLNRRPPQVVKYLAEASFWIYLFHHPVVGLTQVSLSQTGWPTAVRFAVSLASGLGLSLLTYEAFVRRTWVGALLNGRRVAVDRQSDGPVLLPLPAVEFEPRRKSA